MQGKTTGILTAAALIGTVALTGGLVAQVVQSGSQYGNLRSQITQLQADNQRMGGQLAQDEAKLNAASTTGDLITCSDLRSFETGSIQVNVGGTDSYGAYQTFNGIASSSWVPPHCYKP